MQPVSQVLLTVEQALTDELVTSSGIKFYIDPSFKKEWQASVTATIAKLPEKVSPQEKYILDQLKVGDEVGISFQVVADFEFEGDGARFMPTTEENDYRKEFANGKGETIGVYALPKRKGWGIMWAAWMKDRYGNLVSGEQGNEAAIERWMAQFPFGKTDIYKFNNYFEYDKKDYWKCDLSQIFCKRKKGKLIAVSDRIICEPIDEVVPSNVGYLLQSQDEEIKIRWQDRATIVSGGERLGLKKGQVIHFASNIVEKYEMFGKSYYLVKEKFVLGLWN